MVFNVFKELYNHHPILEHFHDPHQKKPISISSHSPVLPNYPIPKSPQIYLLSEFAILDIYYLWKYILCGSL